MKYRKKPDVVDAFLWTGDEKQIEGIKWVHEADLDYKIMLCNMGTPDFSMHILFPNDMVLVKRGDWVVRGVNGEVYSVKPDIFKKTYVRVKP